MTRPRRVGTDTRYWIVNIADRRLEVYRDPVPDAAAAFGWRYGRVATLGPELSVRALAAPEIEVAVGDLLPWGVSWAGGRIVVIDT